VYLCSEIKKIYSMKFNTTPMFATPSGSFGGVVVSHNGSGYYWKVKTIPINPTTIYQQSARALFIRFSQNWRTLSAARQNAWIVAAQANPVVDRIGNLITLSGINFYIRINANIVTAGGTAIDAPVLPLSVAAVTALTGTCVLGVLTATFSPTPVPASTALFIWASGPQSLGVNYVKSKLRLLTVLAPAAASPSVLTTFYTTRFGTIPAVAGSKIILEAQFVNQLTGAVGARFRAVVLTS